MIQRNRFLPLPRARFIQGPLGPRPLLAGLLIGLTVWACGGEETTTSPGGQQQQPPPPTVASVAVTPSTATLVSLGETVQLTASARDASGNTIADKTFTWSSSDDSTATVSDAGLVTAVANGAVTITAASDTVGGTATIEVAQAAAQLTFTVQPTEALIGVPLQPAVEVTAEDARGNLVAGGTNVTLVLDVNPSGATLEGTTTQAVIDGVAAFNDLSVERAGVGYNLMATSGSLLNVASARFDIIALVFAAVSAGSFHTCGLSASGTAYCWGNNYYGKLGDGTSRNNRATPVAVSGRLTFASVSAGSDQTCGVTTTDTTYCWGLNVVGELGDGTTTDRTTPVTVSGGLTFASVSAGGEHTCGLTISGTAYCWGQNLGELGTGSSTGPETCGVPARNPCSRTPVEVTGGFTFASVSTWNSHTCGVTATGTAYCWGRNDYGQMGDGTTTESIRGGPRRTTPAAVSGGLTFASVTPGGLHTCGVTTDGTAYCWGHNNVGQLGDGTTTDRLTPVRVLGQP